MRHSLGKCSLSSAKVIQAPTGKSPICWGDTANSDGGSQKTRPPSPRIICKAPHDVPGIMPDPGDRDMSLYFYPYEVYNGKGEVETPLLTMKCNY